MTEPTDRSTLPITGIAFTALMLVAGAIIALLLKAYPAIGERVPGIMWLLIVAFPFDLATNALAARGTIPPLTMGWRLGGFIAGALLQIAITTYAI